MVAEPACGTDPSDPAITSPPPAMVGFGAGTVAEAGTVIPKTSVAAKAALSLRNDPKALVERGVRLVERVGRFRPGNLFTGWRVPRGGGQ